jgi:hypothetical protein
MLAFLSEHRSESAACELLLTSPERMLRVEESAPSEEIIEDVSESVELKRRSH